MEFQKITNFLNTAPDDKVLPRFVTKKWIEVNDQTGKNNYEVNKEIRSKTLMLRSALCDYSDAYIVVEGDIIVTEPDNARRNKSVDLKIMHHFLTASEKLIA